MYSNQLTLHSEDTHFLHLASTDLQNNTVSIFAPYVHRPWTSSTKKSNYEYMTARNGAEAVDIYKAHPDYFRVIILGMCNFSVLLLAADTNKN